MDPFIEKYRYVIDELGRVSLKDKEGRLVRAVLDYSIGRGRHSLRVTMKKDLEVLTRIELKNLLEPIEGLRRVGMLLEEEIPTGWSYQVTDPGFWNAPKVDAVVYYRALKGLMAHNELSDPHLPTLAPERGLNDFLGVSDFAPVVSAELGSVGCEVDRTGSECLQAGPVNGSNSRTEIRSKVPAHEKAIDEVVAGPGSDVGPANFLRVPESSTAQMAPQGREKGFLWREAQRQAAAASAMQAKEGGSAIERSEPVLKSSTEYLKQVLPVKGSPPGQYSNQVLPSGGVLKSSTGAAILNNGHCNNASSKKHLTLFIEYIRAGRVELHRSASRRDLAKYLEGAGVFIGPNGENYAPFWFKRIRNSKQEVENWFFEMIKKVQEEGVGAIDSPGSFMAGRFYEAKNSARADSTKR